MPLTNTPDHYGLITKTFHWLMAAMILTAIPTAIIAQNMPFDTAQELARKAWFFSAHKTLGVAVFWLAIARILWALAQPRPGLLNADRKLESFAAQTAHWLLYASLVLVPLTGWIHHAATSGFAPIWWPFGQSLPLVPKDTLIAERFAIAHILFKNLMVLTLLAHIGGALKHHFWDRDATLRRMWFGLPAPETAPKQPHSALPLIAACGLLLAVAAVVTTTPLHNNDRQPQTLASVASDWTVDDGTIDIAITQFGSTVAGRFADWTAQISFDPDARTPQKGQVTTTINIASLTLGSVTQEALGPDYFFAGDFPTATFTGDLIQTDAAYLAQGTLQLRDITAPLNFPFALTIDGPRATMTANLTLDRRAFNIGLPMTDEGTLANPVDITLSLTATRN